MKRMAALTAVSVLVFFLIPTVLSSAEGEFAWTIVKEHSSVNFAVKHLLVSMVRGNFRDFSGTVKAGKDGRITYLEGVVKTTSVDTANNTRDNHLRSPDFFDSEKYPEMIAKTKKITWKGNKFTAEADLTIKDVTKTVTVTGEYMGVHMVNLGNGNTYYAGYSCTTKIDRRDFHLAFNKIVDGVSLVGETVEISGDLEIALPAK